MDSKIENRIEKSKQQWEDRNYRIGVVTNQTRAKKKKNYNRRNTSFRWR